MSAIEMRRVGSVDPCGPHPEEARSAVSKDAVSKDEVKQGMREMSKKFLDLGAEVYVEADKAAAVKDSNKAL